MYVAKESVCPDISLNYVIREQKGLNSCTTFAFSDMISISLSRLQTVSESTSLSSLYLYYNARKIINKVNLNYTLDFSEVLNAYQQFGICEEIYWPYEPKSYNKTPPQIAYENARKFPIQDISPISHTLSGIQNSISSGKPVFCGLRLFRSNYMSFHKGEIAKTGFLPYIETNEKVFDNHAVLITGYDRERKVFLARNSFGEAWGIKGYFEIDENYLIDPEKSFSLMSTV